MTIPRPLSSTSSSWPPCRDRPPGRSSAGCSPVEPSREVGGRPRL